MKLLTRVALVLASSTSPSAAQVLSIQPLASGTQAQLRGLSVVDAEVAWASGTDGTVLRTVDEGSHWDVLSVPQAKGLDLRDIQAFDAQRALVLTAGSPGLIIATDDGGKNWQTRYENRDPKIFFDAMAFWSDRQGIACADPIDDRLVLIRTLDGGAHWEPLADPPTTEAGEAAFAASGTCCAVADENLVWIALGGPNSTGRARVLRSTDGGRTWSSHPTPVPASASQGIFSLVFLDRSRGVAVGGDYEAPDRQAGTLASTIDGGVTWTVPDGPGLHGYRSCVAVGPAEAGAMLVAVGTNGVDLSTDAGRTWRSVSEDSFHAIAFAPGKSTGFAVGADGRVARVTFK